MLVEQHFDSENIRVLSITPLLAGEEIHIDRDFSASETVDTHKKTLEKGGGETAS